MAIVTIGILAHVDAGKTSLTERILFETGVIPSVGRVDKGTTQTDSLELERARGITIKSAVVSFRLNALNVNLIDTPGHADFVAEVERSLRVLDGVVLVVSAVEGVQSQTRRLVRAIRAANLPLIIFVNKIDRLGAQSDALLSDIRRKLGLRIVPMTVPDRLGEREASVAIADRSDAAWREPVTDVLAEASEAVIAEFERADGAVGDAFLNAELRRQAGIGLVIPVYFGSAITGVGVSALLNGVEEFFPTAPIGSPDVLDALVFKIVRRSTGEKIVYLRVFSGQLAMRQRVTVRRRSPIGDIETFDERITGIDRFVPRDDLNCDSVGPGEIVAVHGLRSARIGDRIGHVDQRDTKVVPAFPLPALESIVRPVDPTRITHLRTALEELAEQDPLIALRQRNEEGEISVRLYGEVQKEVLDDTLIREYGIAVTFGESQAICIERPIGIGEHIELMGEPGNPYVATVGIRIEVASIGSGIRYERQLGSLPLSYYRAIEETVFETLTQGLYGWEVTDCVVTLTAVAYSAPVTVAADFRNLTPLAVMEALRRAGSQACEPIEELQLEIPDDSVGPVCSALIAARAAIRTTVPDGASQVIVAEVPTTELRSIEQQLPRLTHGDGGWVSSFYGYAPLTGDPPERRRVGPNPLCRLQYLAEVARA